MFRLVVFVCLLMVASTAWAKDAAPATAVPLKRELQTAKANLKRCTRLGRPAQVSKMRRSWRSRVMTVWQVMRREGGGTPEPAGLVLADKDRQAEFAKVQAEFREVLAARRRFSSRPVKPVELSIAQKPYRCMWVTLTAPKIDPIHVCSSVVPDDPVPCEITSDLSRFEG